MQGLTRAIAAGAAIAPVLFATAALAAGEPSEREMRQAIADVIEAANAQYRDLGTRCERREFQGNPIMAMQCLQLCGAGGGKCQVSFSLTTFKKIACEKASGQAGYVCDYVVGFSSDSPFAQNAMNQLTGGGSTGQGRFVEQSKGWLYLSNNRRR